MGIFRHEPTNHYMSTARRYNAYRVTCDPLIRATRKKIAEKEAENGPDAQARLGAKRAELAKAVELIEQQFTTRFLSSEQERIAAEEAEKARLGGRQTLNVSHRRLLTYSASSKNATAN